jgi:hypothetical protein
MHWLLILALIASSTEVRDQSASGANLNHLVENALRQKLGSSVKLLRVNLRRGSKGRGDFDLFDVTLDGFSADRLVGLEKRANSSAKGLVPQSRSFDAGDIFRDGKIGDIFNKGDIGDILGTFATQGRIGKMQIKASNFSFDNVRYDALNLNLNEIKFSWSKALQGDFDIKSIQPGGLSLQLNASQAERLLSPRLPSVKEVKIRFDNGLAYIGGRTDFYGIGVPFEAGGRLSVQTNQVRADDLRLSIAKLRLPSLVINEITRSVNPLFDFDPDKKWPLAVNLNTAAAGHDLLSMSGGLEWLGFNRNEKQKNDRKRDRDQHRNDDEYQYLK